MSFFNGKVCCLLFWSRCLMSFFKWQGLLVAVFGVGV